MIRIIACAAVLTAALPALAQDVALAVGQVSIVTTSGAIGSVVVGDPKIADVAVEGTNSVMVFGKALGVTDLVVFNAAHEVLHSSRIEVLAADVNHSVVVRSPGASGISDVSWKCLDGRPCTKGSSAP